MARPGKPLPPARGVALRALSQCLWRGQDVQAALDASLSAQRLDPRDAGLVTELAYGYLRLKGRVDHVLSRFLGKPGAMPENLALGLGLAAYEILFLDKVPAYASVSWAVDWAKGQGEGRLSGLFNAVLRRVSDLGAAPREPGFYREGAADEVEFLCRWHSCPEWIVRLWLSAYGQERAEGYLAAQTRAPALGLVVSHGRQGRDLARALEHDPDLLAREGRAFAFPPATELDLDGEAAQYVTRQSFVARAALSVLAPGAWPEPVLDACAGRGNKTRHLLELGKSVIASDIHLGRLRALRRDMPEVPCFRARADRPAPLRSSPGSVLLDLPCSGLGVLSRRPDIKWKRGLRDVRDLTRLQAAILDASYEALRPGGVMAVITCTLNPDENELLVEGFRKRADKARVTRTWTTPHDTPLGEFFFSALIEKGK
ncbi:antitermination protein NusB [Desulfovibrio aminophilus]|nr:antitermination protein NusB [Desulfovibrio aminophilus]